MSPTAPIDPGEITASFIEVSLYPSTDPTWSIEMQRAGSASTSSIEREWTLPGTQRKLTDHVPGTTSGKFYRRREIQQGTTVVGDWSTWRESPPPSRQRARSNRPGIADELRRQPTRRASIQAVIQKNKDTGDLERGIAVVDDLASRTPVTGAQEYFVTHGSSVTFSPEFQSAPMVIMSGGKSFASTLGTGSAQYDRYQADGLDATGIDNVVAELFTKGSVSQVTDTYPASTLTTEGDSMSLGGSQGADPGSTGISQESNDNFYKNFYDVNLTVVSDSSDESASLSVDVAVDAWDNGSTAPTWDEKGTKTHIVLDADGSGSTLSTSAHIDFTDSAIGKGDDIRTRIKSISRSGSGTFTTRINPDRVEYTVDSGETATPKSTAGDNQIRLIALGAF